MISYISLQLPKQPGQTQHIDNLPGSATTFVSADIIQCHPGLVLFVVADPQAALQLREELSAFPHFSTSLFPDWETLPYDHFSPDKEITSERLAILYALPNRSKGALIAPITTLLQRVCPRNFLMQHALWIKRGQRFARQQLCQQLMQAGYLGVDQVTAQGEFTVRGSLFDLFPMGSLSPYRIDFFGDEIDSIRSFAIETQRSQTSTIEMVRLLPAHEFATDAQAINCFRSNWRTHFSIRREEEHLYQQISKSKVPAGIEYWQPLFFNEPLPSLCSHLPQHTLVVTIGEKLKSTAQNLRNEIEQRFASRSRDPMRPLLPPDALWLTVEALFTELENYPTLHLGGAPAFKKTATIHLPFTQLPLLHSKESHTVPLTPLQEFLHSFPGVVLFSVESPGQREVVEGLLRSIAIIPTAIEQLAQATSPGYYIMQTHWQQGYIYNDQLVVICADDLFSRRTRQGYLPIRRRLQQESQTIGHLAELQQGAAVVHLEHGIGRYGGLTTLTVGENTAEYFVIHYEAEAKLYVPVSQLHLISRYSSGPDSPAPLHQLGGDGWRRTRQKALEKVRDVAAELLDVYAQRALKPGFAYTIVQEQYQKFCQQFPFDETPDQAAAIQAVLNDMQRAGAMDRLVCGDVGFGKTEVALRAAFVAVSNHKQVLLLVPTTLLAEQHLETFRDRFAHWPIQIEVLSRFRTRKEQQAIYNQLAQGQIDILIGTHTLLQNQLPLKQLGLLIIDEEHRFGVQQKERIKAVRGQIDILTLTATPIPRTLNMALHGIRDLSIIATPPTRRLAVKTFVCESQPERIREAILREILRGGQVYYLHNEVKTIDKTAQQLQTLIPEIRIAIGHGQMRERDLERTMHDFYHQRFNVLVCSTIIETGIDIPTANTMIIDRADHFGLAQLHQLRGRVGRSHHQAYAYLLTPPTQLISGDARKRLEAITALGDLGMGFTLASHDLEIRGAGELLGAEQSGQIAAIGFSLYQELLEKAVDTLREGREPTLETLLSQQPEVELRLAALLPETYVPNVNIRLSFYKRIASTQQEHALQELKAELLDRFGHLPAPADHLFQIARIRQLAQALAIRRIECSGQGGVIDFHPHTPLEPDVILELLQHHPQQLRLCGPTRLQITAALLEAQQRLTFIAELLTTLQEQHHMHRSTHREAYCRVATASL